MTGVQTCALPIFGIVNAKIVSSQIDNIAYAIPSNVARLVAENVIYHANESGVDHVKKASLGVTLSDDTNSHTVYDTETGKVHIIEEVVVVDIAKNSLAEGKIEIGDIITSIKIASEETKSVTRNFHVVERMLTARVGDTVVVEVLRDGEAITLTFVITKDSLKDIT